MKSSLWNSPDGFAPEISILKAKSHAAIGIEQVQGILGPSAIILEYVVAKPQSYCLVISRGEARIISLAGPGSNRGCRDGIPKSSQG
jgi:hypothetical protein